MSCADVTLHEAADDWAEASAADAQRRAVALRAIPHPFATCAKGWATRLIECVVLDSGPVTLPASVVIAFNFHDLIFIEDCEQYRDTSLEADAAETRPEVLPALAAVRCDGKFCTEFPEAPDILGCRATGRFAGNIFTKFS